MLDTQTPRGADFPDANALRIYGDMLFLALRSPHHQRMHLANLREAVEPPVVLGQYQIFRFDEIPRGLFTWARLTEDAERRFVGGEGLRPEDWNGGDRVWIIDLIAPYAGLTAAMVRWIMTPGNFGDGRFRFRRIRDGVPTDRIVEIDLDRPDDKAKILSATDFA